MKADRRTAYRLQPSQPQQPYCIRNQPENENQLLAFCYQLLLPYYVIWD